MGLRPDGGPPAPFLDIRVSLPHDAGRGESLQAKLDTAADISCVPIDLLDRLGLLPARTILAKGYDGIQTRVDTYTITLDVIAARFRYLEVIPIPEEYALLGRDVLNHFYIRLDGPDLTFHMSI